MWRWRDGGEMERWGWRWRGRDERNIEKNNNHQKEDESKPHVCLSTIIYYSVQADNNVSRVANTQVDIANIAQQYSTPGPSFFNSFRKQEEISRFNISQTSKMHIAQSW